MLELQVNRSDVGMVALNRVLIMMTWWDGPHVYIVFGEVV